MEENFVPYQPSSELKELGFDKPCFACYNPRIKENEHIFQLLTQEGQPAFIYEFGDAIYEGLSGVKVYDDIVIAPLWQQAFDWFRENHNLFTFIDIYPTTDNPNRCWYQIRGEGINNLDDEPDNSYMSGWFESYEKARLGCIEKLIKIIKEKNGSK